METIANETGTAPPGGDEPSFEIPLSGKILEPAATTRALAAAAGDPFDITITAAPRYTGLADQVMVRRSWAAVAGDLAQAGIRRADHSSHRGEVGAALREPVQDEIRQLWDKAARLGMPVQTVADLLGVSRQAVYNIIQNKVAGRSGMEVPKVEREPLPPVKWPKRAKEAHKKATEQAG